MTPDEIIEQAYISVKPAPKSPQPKVDPLDQIIETTYATSPTSAITEKKTGPTGFVERTFNWKAAQQDFVEGSIRLKKSLTAVGELLGAAASGAIGGTIGIAAGGADLALSAVAEGLQKAEEKLTTLTGGTPKPSVEYWNPTRAKQTLETISEELSYLPQTEEGQQLFQSIMEPIGKALQSLSHDIASTPFPAPLTGNLVRLKDLISGAEDAVNVAIQAGLLLTPTMMASTKAKAGQISTKLPEKGVGFIEAGPTVAEAAAAKARMENLRNKIWPKTLEEFQKVETAAPSPAARTAKIEPVSIKPQALVPEQPAAELTGTALETEQLAIRKRRQAEEEAKYIYRAPELEKSMEVPKVEETPVALKTVTPRITPPTEPVWKKTPYGGYSQLSPEEIAEVQRILERGPTVRSPEPEVIPEVAVTKQLKKGKSPEEIIQEAYAPPKPIGPLKDAQVKSILTKILSDESGILHSEFINSLSDPFVRNAIDPYLVVYEALLPKLKNVRELPLAEIRKEAKNTNAIGYFDPQRLEIVVPQQKQTFGILEKSIGPKEQFQVLKHEFGGHWLEEHLDYVDFGDVLMAAEKMNMNLPYQFLREYWSPAPRTKRTSARTVTASEKFANIFENTSPMEWARLARVAIEKAEKKRTIKLAERPQITRLKKMISNIEEDQVELRPAFRSASTGKIISHPEAKTHREILQWQDWPTEKTWTLPEELGIQSLNDLGIRYDGKSMDAKGIQYDNFTDQATFSSFMLPEIETSAVTIEKKLLNMREHWKNAEHHEFIVGVPDDLEYGWVTKQGTYVRRLEEALVTNRNEKTPLPDSTLRTIQVLAATIEKDSRPWSEIVQTDFADAIKKQHVDSDGKIWYKGEKYLPEPEKIEQYIADIIKNREEREVKIGQYQDLIDQNKNTNIEAIRKIDGPDSRLTTAEQGIGIEERLIDAINEYADSIDQLGRTYWRKILADQKGEFSWRKKPTESVSPERRIELQNEFLRIGDMKKDAEAFLARLPIEAKRELAIANRQDSEVSIARLAHLAQRAAENIPHKPILTKASYHPILSSETGAVTLRGIGKSIAEFFAPQLGIPRNAAYLAARYKTMGAIDVIEASVKRTWKELDKYDDQIKKDIFRFLDGQIPLNTLPPAVQYIARQLQIRNETIGKALVKRGLLSPDAFEQHRGQYIRYLYLKHILGEDRPITTSGGRLDLTYLKQRKDLTYDQRKALGLIEDVSVAEPMTLSRSLTDIVKYDFFQKVLNDTDWTWQPSTVRVGGRIMGIDALVDEIGLYKNMVKKDPNNPLITKTLRDMEVSLQQAIQASQGKVPEGFHRVPDSKAYGPLRGAYINKRIADDIIPVFGGVVGQTPGAGLFNAIVKMEEKSMAAFKVSKTAVNVPTMFRNMISNVIQLNMSGMNLAEIPYYMEQAAKSWKAKDINWQQARRYGLFKTNWAEGEISEVLKTVQDFQPRSWFHVVDRLSSLAKFYGKIDDFFKMTKFMEQRAKGISIETAALEAQKWGMDYSLTNPTVKLARRHIIPFGTYTYKITPLLAETMVKRPWVIAKYAALIPISYELFKSNNDIDDKEWERLFKSLASYIKHSGSYAVLPMKNAEGHWQWINLEYFFPWQQFHQASTHIIQGRFGELPQDIGITNPYFTILSSLAASKGDNPPIDMWTRQPIYLRIDPPKVKAQKMVEWLYQQWAPPMLTRMGALGYSASVGDITKQHHKITPEEAALRWFGVNINQVTPAQRVIEIKGRQSLMAKELKALCADPSVDPDRRKEALEEYKKQMKELLK